MRAVAKKTLGCSEVQREGTAVMMGLVEVAFEFAAQTCLCTSTVPINRDSLGSCRPGEGKRSVTESEEQGGGNEKTPSTMRGDETVSGKLGTDQRELLRKKKRESRKRKSGKK